MRTLIWVLAAVVLVLSVAPAAADAPRSATFQLAGGQNYVPNQGNVPAPVKPACPSGTIGKWPICIPTKSPTCPRGTIGEWPYCHRPGGDCPKGKRRIGKRCVTIGGVDCPKGTMRVGKKCVRRKKCPDGTTGTWPNCVAPSGRIENLQTEDHCPDGTVGQWPHCTEVRAPCPDGQIRKNNACVALAGTRKAGPSGENSPPAFERPTPATIPPDIAALTANRPHRPREIIVLVAKANADQISARLARDFNVIADPGQPIALLGATIVRLRLVDNRSLEALLAALATDPDVELAQPNYEYQASERGAAAAAAAATRLPQYAPSKLRLSEAHQIAQGTGVKVAIIDTAIENVHPELAGSVAGRFQISGSDQTKPEAHGTAIAGIVAAHAALVGTAPAAKLLSVPAFSGGGATPAQSTSLILLQGVDWAFASGAKVMNMSFTGPSDPLLERIIKAAADKGAIFVAAAGNGGPKSAPLYPAAYPEVIAVTATDEQDALYANANRGSYISVAAPGVDIIVPSPGGGYDLKSGTSMAAAHVSGIIALMIERDRDLDWEKANAALSAGARMPKGIPAKDVGAGIIDAAQALGSL